jgi:hypothetical protein
MAVACLNGPQPSRRPEHTAIPAGRSPSPSPRPERPAPVIPTGAPRPRHPDRSATPPVIPTGAQLPPSSRHPDRRATPPVIPAGAQRRAGIHGCWGGLRRLRLRSAWIPDQVRDDGLPTGHPGRSAAPSLSSRPERRPLTVIPAGAQRRAGIHGRQAGPLRLWLRQAPYGSRIKSGMTGFRVVIPAAAQRRARDPCGEG